jgi:hypothetical protein
MLVRYKNNEGEISDEVCQLIERNGDICRLRRVSGQIFKIYYDRIYELGEEIEGTVEKKESIGEFDPWFDDIHAEVWVKSKEFNGMVCKTYAVISAGQNFYKSINVYNGSAKNVAEYPMRDIEKLRKKLAKGYAKIERETNEC